MKDEEKWDVIVIGGGPSGMMTAGRAAERGLRVLCIEKNDTLGKKLLITGGGRCNVTNGELDTRKFLSKYKENDKFLFSAFAQYDVSHTLDFFHKRGMDTKVENELRVFPVSNSAKSVWDVLVNYMKENNVTVLSNSPVLSIVKEEGKIIGVKLSRPPKDVSGDMISLNQVVKAKSVVVATGGTSRPETGSTGDAYTWLKDLGHSVIYPTPSLVPVALKDKWVARLSGVALENIKLTTFQNGQKQDSTKGKILFTHVGISGPTVLNMSKDIGELLKYGEVLISLDLLPTQDYGVLNKTLQDLFKEHDKKKFKNALSNILPSAITPIVVELSNINPEVYCNSVTREERLRLVQLIKAIPLNVKNLLGEDKAIIASGGLSLEEVDFKTMQSRLFPNLYIVGDMLNIDRPSGGYSLQLCWTTGYVAGSNC